MSVDRLIKVLTIQKYYNFLKIIHLVNIKHCIYRDTSPYLKGLNNFNNNNNETGLTRKT
jgi:hypothetical protein